MRSLVALLTAIVCVLFCGTLRDTPAFVAVPRMQVREVPKTAGDRNATLRVEVVDEAGASVTSAVVSVLSIRDERAYVAGSQVTDAAGVSEIPRLPRGETFVLAEAPGRQRASTRLVLEGRATARLVLRPAGRLAVRVTDEEGKPVPRASVEIRGGDPLPFATTGDGEGQATIARLGAAPYSLRVSAPGYDVFTRSGVMSSAYPVHVVLRQLGQLDVKVVGEDGAAVKEAAVLVAGSGLWPARRAITDEAGKVRIGGLAAGAYDVSASKGDLVADTAIGVRVERGKTKETRLVLVPGRRVAVKVVDDGEDQKTIAGARVVLVEDGVSSFPHEGVTSAEGLVSLGPVSRDRPASVLVRADGFVPRGVLVPASLDGPLVVPLVKGAVLAGEVVDDRDAPVDGASIEVVGVDFAGMPVDATPELASFERAHFAFSLAGPPALIPMGELGVMPGPLPGIPPPGSSTAPRVADSKAGSSEGWVTDRSGRFRAAPVPPGRLRALVRHPGYVEALSEAVLLAPGGEAHVKVILHAGATLSGRVLDESKTPLAGARVEIAALHGTLVRATLTADDGSFGFAAVPREISVTVSRPEAPDAVALRKILTLDEGNRREIDLVLPASREAIEVRVRDDRGYPVAAAEIRALSLDPDSPLRTTRFTGEDGLATIPDAAGIALRVEVTRSGYAPDVRSFEPAPREMSVTLKHGATVTGEVRARGGRDALEAVDVTVYTREGTRHAKTDADGRYKLRDLAPGTARVVLVRKGFSRVEATVTIPENEGDLDRLEMSPAGTVEGEVLDRNGDPVVGARVAVGAAPAYLPVGPLPPGVAVTDARGRFTLADVAEGDVVIEAYSADRGRGRERVRVHPDHTTSDVRIKLDEEVAGAEPASAGGVAITLGETTVRGARRIVVLQVAPGSEAERAGVQPDDVLAKIDAHVPASLEDARRRLSGPLGDDIVLRIVRDGDGQTLRLARERVRR
jgi:protocatechuate 3,4-dioxygenase beta subunit